MLKWKRTISYFIVMFNTECGSCRSEGVKEQGFQSREGMKYIKPSKHFNLNPMAIRSSATPQDHERCFWSMFCFYFENHRILCFVDLVSCLLYSCLVMAWIKHVTIYCSAWYLMEFLSEQQKLGPFMQVLPICSCLLNQGKLISLVHELIALEAWKGQG